MNTQATISQPLLALAGVESPQHFSLITALATAVEVGCGTRPLVAVIRMPSEKSKGLLRLTAVTPFVAVEGECGVRDGWWGWPDMRPTGPISVRAHRLDRFTAVELEADVSVWASWSSDGETPITRSSTLRLVGSAGDSFEVWAPGPDAYSQPQPDPEILRTFLHDLTARGPAGLADVDLRREGAST